MEKKTGKVESRKLLKNHSQLQQSFVLVDDASKTSKVVCFDRCWHLVEESLLKELTSVKSINDRIEKFFTIQDLPETLNEALFEKLFSEEVHEQNALSAKTLTCSDPALLNWLYEKAPNSMCRSKVEVLLHRNNNLNSDEEHKPMTKSIGL